MDEATNAADAGRNIPAHLWIVGILVVLAIASVMAALAPPDGGVVLFLALFLLGYGWNLGFVAGSALLTSGLSLDERTRLTVGNAFSYQNRIGGDVIVIDGEPGGVHQGVHDGPQSLAPCCRVQSIATGCGACFARPASTNTCRAASTWKWRASSCGCWRRGSRLLRTPVGVHALAFGSRNKLEPELHREAGGDVTIVYGEERR